MPDEMSLWLQNSLRDLVADDWSPSRLCFWCDGLVDAHDRAKNADSSSYWQASVDWIVGLLNADLIKVVDLSRYDTVDAMVQALRSYNPYEIDAGGLAWNGTLICGTDLLAKIVEQYFPDNKGDKLTLEPGFISAISRLMNSANMPSFENN